ncbi:MAG: hypothetical protein PWR06_854 [Thermoanaerobacteraceae bacterium]|nr:hypothetical protein [Thermoanaerobacteraceae bacterium]
MQYIRYHEMEALLKAYKDMQGVIMSLKRELGEAMEGVDKNDIDDAILSMALQHSTPDDIPGHSTGSITDKTANIAISYQKRLEDEHKALIDELTKELILLKLISDKLEIGLSSLSETQKNIIEAKYFQKLDWYAVVDKLAEANIFLSKYQAQNIRREAIERLIRITRITIGQYEQVMKLINLKG